MVAKLEKNIQYYYLYSATWILMIGPVLTIFFLQKGLSFSQIMLLQTISSISTVVTEVPSGAVADLYGRKTSMLLSSLSFIIALLFLVYAPNFALLVLAEIFSGMAMSFKSGADSSLVYDTLLKLDREKDYLEVQSRGHSYSLGTQIIGSALAGFLYTVNINLPFFASIILLSLSMFFATRIIEVPVFHSTEKPPYLQQILRSGRFTFSHPKVRTILVFYVFFFFFFRIGFWYYQPYFQAVNIDVAYFGIIFAGFNIIATLSSRYAYKFLKLTKGFSLIALSFLLATSFLLIGLTPHWFGVVFIGLQQVARGVQNPVFLKYVNKQIPSHQRATIISFNSLMGNLTTALLFPIIGLLMDGMAIISLHLLTGTVMMIGCVYFYFYLRKQLGSNRPQEG